MQKTETYQTKYSPQQGKSTALITGIAGPEEFSCETVVFIERPKGTINRIAQGWNVSREDWLSVNRFYQENDSDENLLNIFMDEYGRKQAEAFIFGHLADSAGENLHLIPFKIELEKEEYPIHAVMSLKREFPEQLQWLKEATKSEEIKKVISMAEGINIWTNP